MEKNLFKKITEKSGVGIQYVFFSHSDRLWVIPEGRLKSGMELYQPTTSKGRKLKKAVIHFGNKEKAADRLGIEKNGLKVNLQLQKKLAEITGTDELEYIFYMGDDSSDQNDKILIKILNTQGDVLAYAKLAENTESKKCIDKETEGIRYLKSKEIENVPDILFDGEIDISGDNIRLEVQKADYGNKDRVSLKFGNRQLFTIKQIVDSTKTEMKYEDSDFVKYVDYLDEHSDEFDDDEKDAVSKAIQLIRNNIEAVVKEYSFCHGDYTLWNTGTDRYLSRLYDLEYCEYAMPCYVDVFHYMTQLVLLGKNQEVGSLVYTYRENRKKLKTFMDNPEFIYLCYLVYIISFYMMRTSESSEKQKSQIKNRISMISYLLDKVQIDDSISEIVGELTRDEFDKEKEKQLDLGREARESSWIRRKKREEEGRGE